MVPGFHRFSGGDTNEPSADKAQWILEHLLRLGAIEDRTAIRTLSSGAVFRADLYEQALQLAAPPEPTTITPAPDALELATA